MDSLQISEDMSYNFLRSQWQESEIKEDLVLQQEVIDWRSLNAVSSVRNQLDCGSCWSHAAAAVLEGLKAIKTGQLTVMSVQQQIDCNVMNDGCTGGYIQSTMDYIVQQGLTEESEYPYLNRQDTCQQFEVNYKPTSFQFVQSLSAAALKNAILKNPVMSLCSSSSMEYQFYQGGIFDCIDCFDKLNHAVAVVGYQKLDGQGYFIVKNTKGLDWGEDGYMKIKDVGDGIGVIGIQIGSAYFTIN